MNLEERILLLVPTLFFFVTVAWGFFFQQLIFSEIHEADPSHHQKIHRLLEPHFHQVTYSDAIFLFMVNGIIWVLQLYRQALGVIIMVAGVIISVTGLLATFTWRYQNGPRISKWMMWTTLVLAAIEFGLFIFIP